MKRLGIFVFYDKDNFIDDYVTYLLSELRKCCDRFVIISNCNLSETERSKFKKYSEDIYTRENVGMDAGALKFFFTEVATANSINLSGYDEIFWMNDTCYGPFAPLESIFEEMEKRAELDFWGLTIHSRYERPFRVNAIVPEHVQSYFVAVRKRLFTDACFTKFWQSLAIENGRMKVVYSYEAAMTSQFVANNFTYGAYCDTRDLFADEKYTSNPTYELITELVNDYGFPFLKRKAFAEDLTVMLRRNNGTEISRALDYIKNETDYPVEYIYKNLIRQYPREALKQSLHLKFVIPSDYIYAQTDVEKASAAEKTTNDATTTSAGTNAATTGTITATTTSTGTITATTGTNAAIDKFCDIERYSSNGKTYLLLLPTVEDTEHNKVSVMARKRWLRAALKKNDNYIKNVIYTFEHNEYIGALTAVPSPIDVKACSDDKENKEYKEGNTKNLNGILKHGLWIREELYEDYLRHISDENNKNVKVAHVSDKASSDMNSDYDDFDEFLRSKAYLRGEIIEQHQAERLLEINEELHSDANSKKLKKLEFSQKFFHTK